MNNGEGGVVSGVPKHTKPIWGGGWGQVTSKAGYGYTVTRHSGNENPFVQKASKKYHTKY